MKLHFKKYGNGPPLLILHGLFGCADNWQTLGKKFSANYQIYLIDLRNHGHSPQSSSFNYDVMSEDLNELIINENLENIYLLGHSMGGKVAMRITQMYPNYVKKLIVADIGRKKYSMHHDQIIKGLSAINLNTVKSRSAAKEILSKFISGESLLQFLLKNLYWKTKGQLAWRMNLPILIKNMNEILAEIPAEIVLTPTLFLKGEKSNYIEESDFDDIMYYFPNNEIETIYNAGHWLHADNPLDFHELVTEFIET